MANSQSRKTRSHKKNNVFKQFWEDCCTELPAEVDAPSLPRVIMLALKIKDTMLVFDC